MATQGQSSKRLSRRDMLKLSSIAAAGTILAACGPKATPATQVPPTEAVPAAEKPTEAVPAAEKPTEAPAAKKVEGTVVIMHQSNELSGDQIKQFETKYPGIKVEFIELSDLTRFFAMYAAGTPPDLVRLQAPSIPGMLARKLLHDLTPYYETSTILKPDDLMPANNYYKAESALKIGSGKIYGMCKDFSPDFTVFAYKPAFEAAKVTFPDDTKALTYAEVRELAKQVGKFEGDRTLMFGYGYADDWIDRIWMNHLAEKDQNLYSEGYEKIILSGNEETKKILQYYFDFAKEKLTPSPLNPSPAGWFGTDFTAGQLAMCQYGFWYSAMAVTDVTKDKIAMLPGPTWAGQRRDPTMTATGMVMSAPTQNPDAAWKLFEWYNGEEPATDRAKSGWGVPALKSMVPLIPQETDFQKQVNKVLQAELALNTPPLQFNPFIGETVVSASWKKNLDEALRGNIDFDKLMANMETEVNTAIKDGISTIMG